MTAIRVLIVDDHALVREGIRQALAAPGFEVVAEAGDGAEGIAKARQFDPDVVLLDISLPGENGLRTAARLRADVPGSRILMLSVYDQPEYVLEAVRVGAHGYLLKDTLPAELRQAIQTVAAGGTLFERVLSGPREPEPRVIPGDLLERLDQLTRREREVLVGIAGGKTNKEMAAALGLSPRTVESYRESLIRKLGIPSVAGLTKFALDAGLLGR
ncbi:MAG TPA: response regulator transcription factor [Gemmatimonadales bacterium]